MFEVGRLVARITLDGAATFGRDLKQIGTEFKGLDEKGVRASTNVGTALATVGGSILALSALAVARFAVFDKAMSQVRANVQGTPADFKNLEKAALEAGASTVYSASEAAEGIAKMAKAGVSASAIMGGGLTGALALAAAGEISVADAADVASTAMVQFRLSGEDIPHLADLLAAGANKATGGVAELGMALKQSGLVASQMGLSVEETIGTLTAFAKAGLLGSDGGTSFRTMLLSLANPSGEATALLEKYNIEVYDAAGQMKNTAGIAEELKTGLGGLTNQTRDAALATIFGSDAIRGANVLYQNGAKGIRATTKEIDDYGFATRQAAELQNNLAGDVEKLGGAFDSALIASGAGANGVLRDMVQALSGLIDAYSSLPPEVQQGALMFGIAAGAVLLFGGMLLITIPKIVEFRTAVSTLNAQVPTLGKRLGSVASFLGGPWGLALTAATILLGRFLSNQAQNAANIDELTDSLDKQTGALTKSSRAAVVKQLGDAGILKQGKAIGVSLDKITDAALGNESAMQEVVDANNVWYQSLDTAGKLAAQFSFDKLNSQLRVVATDVKDAGEQFVITEEAMKGTEEGAAGVADAYGNIAASTEEVIAANADLLESYAGADAAFVDILGAYDTVIQKNTDVATATADATTSADDSWTDFYDGFTVGLDQFLAELQAQVDAQNAWETNMVLLSGRASAGMLEELAKLGPEGAPLVADLVNATDEELSRMESLFREKSTDATNSFAETLDGSGPIIRAAAAQLGTDAAAAIAKRLSEGTATVEEIMQEYKLKVQGYVPRIDLDTATAWQKIMSLQAQIRATTGDYTFRVATGPGGQGGQTVNADGSITHYYARGGREAPHIAQIERAGVTRVWAEPETGGELYAPLAPSKRGRTMQIIGQQLGEWGYDIVPRAGGDSSSTSAASGAGSAGPMRLTGTLDLGNGLVGFVDGIVQSAMDRESDDATRGARKP